MDPRQTLSRNTPSTMQQSPYSNPNMASAYGGGMQQYSSGTHLPPITSQYPNPSHLPPAGQTYMQNTQPFRTEIGRYASNPSPAATPDRFGQPLAPQQNMGGLSQTSMLPQPQGHAAQQPYTTQPGTRPSTYPQPLAPAPPRSSMDPYGGYGQAGDNRQWAGAEQIPGRPPVMQNGLNGSPKGNTIPQKDADGKFPCPNCTKTYLHAKHLKRHMLRHTGDRPYMCVLCTDTFSRSDILKRHFQKCSIRRGNPTGASHLSNPAAHLKKSQAAAQKAAAAAASANAAANGGAPSSANAVQPSPYTSASMPGASLPATSASLPAMSTLPYANGQADGRPVVGQGPDAGSSNSWSMQQHMRTNQNIYNANSAPAAQTGHHMNNDDWNQFMPPTTENNYVGNMYGYSEQHPDVKAESHEAPPNGYYMSNGVNDSISSTARNAK